MRLLQAVPSGLLTILPLLGLAQTASPYPHYYVGLGLYASDYQPLGGAYYRGVTVPVQLTVGYQLRSRLAVQAGIAYSNANTSSFGLGKYYSGSSAAASPAAYFEYNGTSYLRTTSTTLLARYTLTRQATHRFQVDVLGGLTLVNRRYAMSQVRTDIDSTQAVVATADYASAGAQNNFLLTAGASARYRFGQHLEAMLDFTLNHDFNHEHHSSSSVLTGTTALGLRYRFGGLR